MIALWSLVSGISTPYLYRSHIQQDTCRICLFISDPKQADNPHAEDENDKRDYDTYWGNI
ncbi:hypothetical protein F4823DRAFT_193079 [Ustulina deusta]|nr:hypothetical protein F4823DRAFT_193079 [Ustulina deusta]